MRNPAYNADDGTHLMNNPAYYTLILQLMSNYPAYNLSDNQLAEPYVAVSSVSLALLAVQRRVYEHRWKNLLESFFTLNLGILSVATFYVKEESKGASQFIILSISIGIAFIALIGILIYHTCLVFKSTSSLWKVHLLPFIKKSHRIFKATSVSEGEKIAEGEENTEIHTLPTLISEIGVELRETLLELESDESGSHAATY